MIRDLSEQGIRDHCPHCDYNGWAFKYILTKSLYFNILCDVHPLVEGHLLIIPKRHTSCAGEYTAEEWEDFKKVYQQICRWVYNKYGSVATFEHGKIGQTVFHSHVHVLPFQGEIEQIVPEGKENLQSMQKIEELIDLFQREGQYLFFSINQQKWIVDTSLGFPRFFRDRFARALGCHQRADWKATSKDPKLMAIGREENERCQSKFFQDPISLD